MAIIYRIYSADYEGCYIGHTTMRLERRKWLHLDLLRKGKHHATALQAMFNSVGEDAVIFEIVEECDDEDRIAREQYWIDNLDSRFNSNRIAHENGKFGYKLTDEQLARQWIMDAEKNTAAAAKRVGLKRSDEQRARMSEAQQNNPLAGQHRVGVKETPEQTETRMAAVRAAKAENPKVWITNGTENRWFEACGYSPPDGWWYGRTMAAEHVAAIQAATGPRTEESKAQMASSAEAAWQDPEKRARMMAARKPFTWINDGMTSRRHHLDQPIPEGWKKGRLIDVSKLVAGRKRDDG